MYRVLVSDSMAREGLEILRASPGIEVTVQTSWQPGELRERIRDYHALLVRSATRVDAGVIEAAERLRLIGRAGIGVDTIDLQAATRRGVVVMNTPTGNTVTTAEHAIAMLLALARKIPQATASMKAGRWEKKKFEGVEVFEKTLGLIGLGNIGSIVARRAAGLGMRVIAYDPFIAAERAQQLRVALVGLDELYASADFVSVHVPRSDQTRNLLRAEAFAAMKPGVRVVNCARGGIVNEADLVAAIRAGRVAGAALDVFEQEPLDPASPLLGLDEVILTPHLGASTAEAQVNVAVDIARQTVDFLLRGVVRNAVNLPALDQEALARLGPYLDLAGRMGRFLGQYAEGRMEEIETRASGEIAGADVRPLTAALVHGLLQPILRDEVNPVNALLVARERGLRVTESASTETGEFTSLLVATLRTDAGSAQVAGTLSARREPRIVGVDGCEFEFPPAGHLLAFVNEDTPGVVGRVGTLLGESRVNIGWMQLGRAAGATEAHAVLSVDSAIPAEALERIRALPFIRRARQLDI